MDIKYIDLFAGLGGIRIGLEQALESKGLKGRCVFTSEIKPAAIEALNHNFKEGVSITDITTVDEKQIPSFNILLGGFPCQAFSTAGKKRGFEDTRGTLFFFIHNILKKHLMNVDGFILENVEGLISHDKRNPNDKIGNTLSVILNVLQNELKFNVSFALLDASDFGVAQSRKRVYIVGCKKKYGKVNLKFKKQHKVTVQSCLHRGLPAIKSPFTSKLLSHFSTEELMGKYLKDKRGGEKNIHSWDFEYRGPISEDQKQLLNLLLKERRKKKWAPIIGIDWMDGMPLTIDQISTFYQHDDLVYLLEDLCKKKYLVFEHPKKLIRRNGYTERIPDTTKAKGYNIVTGKLSFEFSHILDSNGIAPTIVAMDMNTLGVVDNGGIRHLTLREGLNLFGYPNTYDLDYLNSQKGGLKKGYDLLGNSVCVPVIKEIATRLLDKIYKV